MAINVAVAGFGYWGPNIARNVFQSTKLKLVCVCDPVKEMRDKARKLYPHIKLTSDYEELINDKSIEAICIATPVHTHFDLARKAILGNKHVLLEKPMTASRAQAEELVALAEKHHKVLLVNHIFLYNGAVRKIKNIIEKGAAGPLKYIDSTRINLGIFQQDVNVLWDLASHDIAIVNYLTPERPQFVQAIGKCHYHSEIENIAFLILHYESGLIAHFNCSWSSPVKIRRMLIGGQQKKIVFDDIEPSDKIKIYDSGITLQKQADKQKILVDYRTGDISVPKFSIAEPLSLVMDDFAQAIKTGNSPLSDGRAGLDVVKVLELAQQSLKLNGQMLKYE